MRITSEALAGKRVLIVEGETFFALLLEDILIEVGCIPVRRCSSVAKALEVVGSERLDLAILDVNLDGERSYPIAEALTKRCVPFLFVSSYSDEAMPADRGYWKLCTKPFRVDDLSAMLSAVLGDAGSPGHAIATS